MLDESVSVHDNKLQVEDKNLVSAINNVTNAIYLALLLHVMMFIGIAIHMVSK